MFELPDSKPSIADRVAARAAAWPAWRSPFGVLCRTFFAQFFTSEIVTSDMRLRQAMIGVLAFLLMPGLMMMNGGLRMLEMVEFRARHLHASGMLEPVLAYLASALITYSMVTVSFVAVLEWDALGFDRRDAMVLGPLPIRGSTIIGGKLAALVQATADFILLTLARCRAQQELIAINTALGAAVVIAGLARGVPDLPSLTRPRTAVLWIPLVLAYSMVIGLRASFFVPSELRGSWTFRINGPEPTSAYWSAMRASMTVLVVPPTVLVAMAILVPLLGWRMAAIHTLSMCAVVIVLIELVALTITFVPFTRAYLAGHANLKSLWWLYVLGLLAFAYWPARFELSSIRNPAPLLEMTAALAVAIGTLEIIGRRRIVHWSAPEDDAHGDDPHDMTVLDIGPLVHWAPAESGQGSGTR